MCTLNLLMAYPHKCDGKIDGKKTYLPISAYGVHTITCSPPTTHRTKKNDSPRVKQYLRFRRHRKTTGFLNIRAVSGRRIRCGRRLWLRRLRFLPGRTGTYYRRSRRQILPTDIVRNSHRTRVVFVSCISAAVVYDNCGVRMGLEWRANGEDR